MSDLQGNKAIRYVDSSGISCPRTNGQDDCLLQNLCTVDSTKLLNLIRKARQRNLPGGWNLSSGEAEEGHPLLIVLTFVALGSGI